VFPGGIAFAVSKPYSGFNRYLFVTTKDGELARYSITSSGIGSKTVLINDLNSFFTSYNYTYPFFGADMALSPDQNYLSWIGGSLYAERALYQVALNNYSYSSIKRFVNITDWATSVAYNSASSQIYVTTENGIKSISASASSGSSFSSAISGTSIFKYNNIRLGYDNRLYSMYDFAPYKLGAIDIDHGNVIDVSSSISSFVRYLPMQVAGENYHYFYTGTAVATSASQLNGQNPNSLGTLMQLYTCQNMQLTGTSGYAAGRSVRVRSIDVNGNYLSGGIYLGTYTTSWPSGNIDLKSMPGTNGAWLADPLHAGYYEVGVITTNTCGVKTEQYFYIRVDAPPATPSMEINNEAPNGIPDWLELYTCQDINLTGIGSVTPVPVQYKVDITQILSDGTPLATGGYAGSYINYAGQQTIDLKNFPSGSGIFNNPLNGGNYYQVRITIKDLCNVDSYVDFFVKLNAPPSAATINLLINSGGGVSCLSKNPASMCLGGAATTSFNIGNTTFGSNNITGYIRTIEEVNCSTGSSLGTVYSELLQPAPNSGNAFGININNFTAGYFVNKVGHCYKLTVYVENACSNVSDWSYFNLNTLYKPAKDGDLSLDDMTRMNPIEINLLQNPVKDKAIFNCFSELERNGDFGLYDIAGKLVSKELVRLAQGKGDFSVNVSLLPSGIYFYKIICAGKIFQGKLVKE